MTLVDSKAAFERRCKDKPAEDVFTKLAANGVETFASLAYACGTPQEKPSTREFDDFAAQILGAGPTVGAAALLKRLDFESVSFVIAQLRQSVSSESTETVRKLPLAEKQARADEQRVRLAGVMIERDMVPSHELVDLCSHMNDVNAATWIAPSKCTSREAELQHSSDKRDKVIRLKDHTLKITDEGNMLKADCSDAMKLLWC